MTIEELRKKYLQSLQSWEADTILQHTTKRTKEYILTHPKRKINLWQLLRFFYYIFQFNRGVPLAYITHQKEFYGLIFYVDKKVLVPRPETELMVDEALEIIKKETPDCIVELGTGSGCVSVSIIKNSNKKLQLIATDISSPALQVAKINAARHNVKIDFRKSNLLEKIQNEIANSKNLLIIANLPYGWRAWKNNGSLETKRLNYEPQIALFTGDNGLELYRRLLVQLKNLNKNFTALFEFDPRQTQLLKNILHSIFPLTNIEIKKDLAGRDRLAVIKSS